MKELKALKAKLEAERAAIVAKAKPHHDEYEALAKKIQPLEAQQREAAAKFKAIEQPRLAELDSQIGRLAMALGAKTLSGSQ